MEVIGLCLSIPLTLVATVAFCFLARAVFERLPPLRVVGAYLACMALLSAVAELILTATIGPVRLHDQLGVGYWVFRTANFFLAAPSVGTLLLSGRPRRSGSGIPIAPVLACWAVAVASVFFNVFVSEAVDGVDGTGVRPH